MAHNPFKMTIENVISEPGSPRRINEDTLGYNDHCVFVIDGATGLGDKQYISETGSDASWFAQFAKNYFIQHMDGETSSATVIKSMMIAAKVKFESHTHGQDVPKYAWPNASLAMLRKREGQLEFIGLGDCTIHLLDRNDFMQSFCAMEQLSDVESANAKIHLKRVGGMKNTTTMLSEERTLEHLREIRSQQNTMQSGFWTLGMVPEAADHLVESIVELELPADALLCSDGFNALCDSYRKYSPKQMVTFARSQGLDVMGDALRKIERIEDPDASSFPRFKQSDDATAVLIKIHYIKQI